MQKDENIHIIELNDAQNNLLSTIHLKDEIDIITGMFAVAYITIDGAINLNGFKEEGQFKFPMLSVNFNHSDTTYSIPIQFQNIQGFVSAEEGNFNFNKQVLFKPLPLYKKVLPNTLLKIKYRNSVSNYRFKHDIKLYLTYIDKD
jgi:hypothetical protein